MTLCIDKTDHALFFQNEIPDQEMAKSDQKVVCVWDCQWAHFRLAQ